MVPRPRRADPADQLTLFDIPRPGIAPHWSPEAVSRLQRSEVFSEHVRSMTRHNLAAVIDRMYWETPARLADLASVLGCSVASLHRRTAGRVAVLGCPACSRRTEVRVGSRTALSNELGVVWGCGCGWHGHRALIDLRIGTETTRSGGSTLAA